jgi:general secretion pathway protein G
MKRRERGWQRYARGRGLTLVELMVVITLIGLLTAAIGVAVFHFLGEGKRKTATIACNHLRATVQAHLAAHGDEAECPTPAAMSAAGELDATFNASDPWGTPYRIECSERETVAVSAGPDRAFGSDDDIRVPTAHRPAGVATR